MDLFESMEYDSGEGIVVCNVACSLTLLVDGTITSIFRTVVDVAERSRLMNIGIHDIRMDEG